MPIRMNNIWARQILYMSEENIEETEESGNSDCGEILKDEETPAK
jgi:hypothetical protein